MQLPISSFYTNEEAVLFLLCGLFFAVIGCGGTVFCRAGGLLFGDFLAIGVERLFGRRALRITGVGVQRHLFHVRRAVAVGVLIEERDRSELNIDPVFVLRVNQSLHI